MSDLVVLLSCMNSDRSIIQKSNIQTDVIVVNQNERDLIEDFVFFNKKGEKCKAQIISSTTRGLSRSRNIAINHAKEWKYGLLCDDDELFTDDYEERIINEYNNNEVDLIAFQVVRTGKRYPDKAAKMSLKTLLRTSSVQITFKLSKIYEKDLRFDEEMGAGSGNGSGEEVKFLMDCRKSGIRLYYHPAIIASLKDDSESTWFTGFNERYFQNRGWASRRTFGLLPGITFMLYNIMHNRKKFMQNGSLTVTQMIKNSIIGIFDKR